MCIHTKSRKPAVFITCFKTHFPTRYPQYECCRALLMINSYCSTWCSPLRIAYVRITVHGRKAAASTRKNFPWCGILRHKMVGSIVPHRFPSKANCDRLRHPCGVLMLHFKVVSYNFGQYFLAAGIFSLFLLSFITRVFYA